MAPHRICVRNTVPNTVLSGTNAAILLDGFPVNDLVAFKLEWNCDGVAIVSLTLCADVQVENSTIGVLELLTAKN